MISMNLKRLRKKHGLSQERLAEQLGVSRQSVAKWENGEALPDILNCEKLADIFKISIDDLVKYDVGMDDVDDAKNGKYIFGAVTVGERGQIVIPIKAREVFDIKPGDKILILGDEAQGIALVKLNWYSGLIDKCFPKKGGEE